MATHTESYLCITCNAIVPPAYRWVGSQVEASCPGCGRRFGRSRPTPAVLAAVGPRPARGATGDLFGEGDQ